MVKTIIVPIPLPQLFCCGVTLKIVEAAFHMLERSEIFREMTEIFQDRPGSDGIEMFLVTDHQERRHPSLLHISCPLKCLCPLKCAKCPVQQLTTVALHDPMQNPMAGTWEQNAEDNGLGGSSS